MRIKRLRSDQRQTDGFIDRAPCLWCVFSLNVPVPPAISRELESRRPLLAGAANVRDRRTLVVKRLPASDWDEFVAVEREVRRALADWPRFGVATAGLGCFRSPPAGSAPVVYLAIESPGLQRLHEHLVDILEMVPGIEGPDYVPHITLARGDGALTVLEQLREIGIADHEWEVDRLTFWNSRRQASIGDLHLQDP